MKEELERKIEKLVDRGWEVNEGGSFPNQFTSDQIDMVRTALTEAYEAGRKYERAAIQEDNKRINV